MKEILPTNSDKKILVDDEDYPLLSRFNWYVSDMGYAVTQLRGQKQFYGSVWTCKKCALKRMHEYYLRKKAKEEYA